MSGDSRWGKANVNIIPISMCVSTAWTGRERLLGGNVANFKYMFIQAIISCINMYFTTYLWNNCFVKYYISSVLFSVCKTQTDWRKDMLFPLLKQCCGKCLCDRNCWEMGLSNWGNVCNVWLHYNKQTERNKHPITSVCIQWCSRWSCWPTDLFSHADFVHLFVGRYLQLRL